MQFYSKPNFHFFWKAHRHKTQVKIPKNAVIFIWNKFFPLKKWVGLHKSSGAPIQLIPTTARSSQGFPFLGHLQPQIAAGPQSPLGSRRVLPQNPEGRQLRGLGLGCGPWPAVGPSMEELWPDGWGRCSRQGRVREADPVPLVLLLLLTPYYFQLLLPLPLPCKRRTCIYGVSQKRPKKGSGIHKSWKILKKSNHFWTYLYPNI